MVSGRDRSINDRLVVRVFDGDDLPAVVEFANRVLGDYAGTNVRTVQDMRWRLLDRPGVEPAGAMLLARGDEIVGYAVVRLDGEILDCVVAPGRHAAETMQRLLDAAEEYATGAGATRLLMNLPADRRDLRMAAEKTGFAGSAATNLYLGPKDFPALAAALVERTGAGRMCDLGFDIRTPVKSEQVQFRLNKGVLDGGDPASARFRVIAGRGALASIFFSNGSVFRSVLERELIVRPLIALPMIAGVLRRMANRSQWFFNRADIL